MNRILLYLTFLVSVISYGQKYEKDLGDIKNLDGVRQYKVAFEYSEELKVPTYRSEKEYLTDQEQKKNSKEDGTGELFRNLWFDNRTNRYEPTFIKEFNDFRLKEKQVTVSKNYSEVRHIMLIKLKLIYPGYEGLIWDKAARLEATIHFMDNESPNVVLFATKTIKIHGMTYGDTFEKITTAYGELGRWTAKFLCRNT